MESNELETRPATHEWRSREECFELFGVAIQRVMEDHYGHVQRAA